MKHEASERSNALKTSTMKPEIVAETLMVTGKFIFRLYFEERLIQLN